MKHLLLSALLVATAPAWAGGKPPPPHHDINVRHDAIMKQWQEQSAVSDSTSSAVTGASTSTGGSVNDSSRMYVLPAPVWTTAPAVGTCIRSTSSAFSIGWNFFSVSNSETYTEYEQCMQRYLRDQAAIVAHMYSHQVVPVANVKPGPCKTPGFKRNSAGRCYDPAWTRCPPGTKAVCVPK